MVSDSARDTASGAPQSGALGVRNPYTATTDARASCGTCLTRRREQLRPIRRRHIRHGAYCSIITTSTQFELKAGTTDQKPVQRKITESHSKSIYNVNAHANVQLSRLGGMTCFNFSCFLSVCAHLDFSQSTNTSTADSLLH